MVKGNGKGRKSSNRSNGGNARTRAFAHRQDPGRRPVKTINTGADSYLIVTEGTQTEPNYFQQLVTRVKNAIGGNLYVRVEGRGQSHTALIDATKRIVEEDSINYQHVWVVFDCDDRPGEFDAAIREAHDAGYDVAWSNQCFEYWICLHFERSDAALSRHDWLAKAEALFKQNNIPGGYAKNRKDLYDVLQSEPAKPRQAKKWAKDIRDGYSEHARCSQMDPCTRVDILVSELEAYLGDSGSRQGDD